MAPVVGVIMGASGTGKSTVAGLLAHRLGWPSAEGDDFHSAANVAKMHAGHPLTDADRWPWLRTVAAWIGEREAAGTGGIVTCSALKRSYRDLLRDGHPDVRFVCLVGDRDLIRQRMEHRTDHFMPPSLLDSQLATLEPLQPDEPGGVVDVGGPASQTLDQAVAILAAPTALHPTVAPNNSPTP
ncbi:MAG: gluconokinase [Actinobacteria bacterium]|nr:gluconokinase [Actinomycetota bacterium]